LSSSKYLGVARPADGAPWDQYIRKLEVPQGSCSPTPEPLGNEWKGKASLYVFFVAVQPSALYPFDLKDAWVTLGRQNADGVYFPDKENTNGHGKLSQWLRPIYVGETKDVWKRFQDHKSISSEANTIASNFFRCGKGSNGMGEDVGPAEYDLYFAWAPTQYLEKFDAIAAEAFLLNNFDFPRNAKDNSENGIKKRLVKLNLHNFQNRFTPGQSENGQDLIISMTMSVIELHADISSAWGYSGIKAIEKERMGVMANKTNGNLDTDYEMKATQGRNMSSEEIHV